MEHGAKAHLKHLTEYFGFLYEFSRMGEEESKFLLAAGAINTMVHFYLGQKAHDFVSSYLFIFLELSILSSFCFNYRSM